MKGYSIHGEPRTTGDGYYESVIADPEEIKLNLLFKYSVTKLRVVYQA